MKFSCIRSIIALFCCNSAWVGAADWISDPSYYTHSPQSGTRVAQYAPIGPFFVEPRPDYMESGYHQERSSIRVGDSTDNYVRMTRWGEPVRPYGEWQFPFRPYSVPSHLWAAPYGDYGYYLGPYYGQIAPVSAPGSGPYHGKGDDVPYARRLTDDTWYDRRTRPQGRSRGQFPDRPR